MTEIAPNACIVCGEPMPDTPSTWFYLSGAIPLGSMACSPECAAVAVKRFQFTGRCDAKEEKS